MRYALKKVNRIRLFDPATDELKVVLSDIKNATLTNGQETVYADGADGAHLAAFDNNKTSTLAGENGAIESGYLSMSVGSDEITVKDGMEIVLHEEATTQDGSTVVLKHKAQGTAGSEIKFIYSLDSTGSIDKKYAQGASASESEFSYAPDTKTITLPTGVFVKGDVIVVEYSPKFSEYKEIVNDADKFSMTCKAWCDCWFTDICTKKDVPLLMYLPSGKVSGNLEMTFGDQAAVQNFEIEALQSGCRGASKTLWKLFTYSEEDVTDEGE